MMTNQNQMMMMRPHVIPHTLPGERPADAIVRRMIERDMNARNYMGTTATAATDIPDAQARRATPSREKKTIPFTQKLIRLFDQEPALIQWRDGTIFIPDPKKLEKKLPLYFRSKNYTSFQRQLNNFGFNKVDKSSGPQNSLYIKVKGEQMKSPLELLALRPIHTLNGGRKRKSDTSDTDTDSSCMPPSVKAKTESDDDRDSVETDESDHSMEPITRPTTSNLTPVFKNLTRTPQPMAKPQSKSKKVSSRTKKGSKSKKQLEAIRTNFRQNMNAPPAPFVTPEVSRPVLSVVTPGSSLNETQMADAMSSSISSTSNSCYSANWQPILNDDLHLVWDNEAIPPFESPNKIFESNTPEAINTISDFSFDDICAIQGLGLEEDTMKAPPGIANYFSTPTLMVSQYQ